MYRPFSMNCQTGGSHGGPKGIAYQPLPPSPAFQLSSCRSSSKPCPEPFPPPALKVSSASSDPFWSVYSILPHWGGQFELEHRSQDTRGVAARHVYSAHLNQDTESARYLSRQCLPADGLKLIEFSVHSGCIDEGVVCWWADAKEQDREREEWSCICPSAPDSLPGTAALSCLVSRWNCYFLARSCVYSPKMFRIGKGPTE